MFEQWNRDLLVLCLFCNDVSVSSRCFPASESPCLLLELLELEFISPPVISAARVLTRDAPCVSPELVLPIGNGHPFRYQVHSISLIHLWSKCESKLGFWLTGNLLRLA